MKTKKYIFASTLVFSLFFIWAISSNLLPTMIRQLMKTCEINAFQASFTETAYWLAYFIFPIPIAMFMKRYGYKGGIIFGLVIAAVGGLLFFPAAGLNSYWAYLSIFFIIATGMCFLETAANPYIAVLGDPEDSTRRLNLAQSFNGLGAFVAAMFFSKLVLSGKDYTRDTLPADFPGGWEGYIQFETDAMRVPYLILGGTLILLAILFAISKLPNADEEQAESTSTRPGKLISFDVLKRSHLKWGLIAQFFYNGGQTAINSLFLVYCCTYVGMSESTATTFFGCYMLAFLLGRWLGTLLMVRFRPQDMLVVYALANVLLCLVIMVFGGLVGVYAMLGVSFFMSIMYPTQFSLALKDLGTETKSGSAFLVMAIVGNACLPPLTAYFMNQYAQSYQLAYAVPLVCFVCCAYYGWKGYRVVD